MGNEQWIDCQVFPGMFSDERAVQVGKDSYFVDANVVRSGRDHAGKLRVIVVEGAGGKKWAILPTNMRDSIPYSG